MNHLQCIDQEVVAALNGESKRIETTINLIASENYTWPAVLEATGSIMTNKYAEGYPGARYYAGCQWVDVVENLAIERCKKLFGAEHANVQPHSGSQANMAVYFSVLEPGDTILGMDLSAGGHLTHGYKLNFSGKLFNAVSYTVDRTTELLDYDQIRELALLHRPKLIVCGASAYSRIIDFKRLKEIAEEVNAYLMADIAHIAGLVATGLHPSPIPYADFVTSTTHKTLRGPRGGLIMCKKEHAERIDKSIIPGIQGGPLMHHIAAKAVGFKYALTPEFAEYQKQICLNAKAMAEACIQKGFRVVAGGTDNHLFILDLRSKNKTGQEVEKILESIGIYVNRNCIPFDPERPLITSGIRMGTPAITARGCKEKDCIQIVEFIHKAIAHSDDPIALKILSKQIRDFCAQFPVYESNITMPIQEHAMKQSQI